MSLAVDTEFKWPLGNAEVVVIAEGNCFDDGVFPLQIGFDINPDLGSRIFQILGQLQSEMHLIEDYAITVLMEKHRELLSQGGAA